MKDIKGISPAIVQYRIHLIDEATPRRDPQRRLNPLMQEAVKAEILKLLDNGIIYPISHNQWVSPVHAVPKKDGFTLVENVQKELVQIRLPTKIRVYIDYRKLNAATHKDHFPLPFIDQMLERLDGHESSWQKLSTLHCSSSGMYRRIIWSGQYLKRYGSSRKKYHFGQRNDTGLALSSQQVI